MTLYEVNRSRPHLTPDDGDDGEAYNGESHACVLAGVNFRDGAGGRISAFTLTQVIGLPRETKPACTVRMPEVKPDGMSTKEFQDAWVEASRLYSVFNRDLPATAQEEGMELIGRVGKVHYSCHTYMGGARVALYRGKPDEIDPTKHASIAHRIIDQVETPLAVARKLLLEKVTARPLEVAFRAGHGIRWETVQ